VSIATTVSAPRAFATWIAQSDRAAPLEVDCVDGVVARPHHVAGEEGDVVGQPVGHWAQREVGVGDEHRVGLGPLQVAEHISVPEDTPVVALVEVAAAAEEAIAASRAVAAEDAVALLDPTHAVADGRDRADVLVADREARRDLNPAVVDMEVGAADAARLDADDRIAGLDDLGVGALLDRDLAGGLEGDGSHRPGLYPAEYAGPPSMRLPPGG
jgi:hypothetical protein